MQAADRPRTHAMAAYAVLLCPALALDWIHHTCFPAVVSGMLHLHGTRTPLSAGFEWLRSNGWSVYLLPVIVAGAGASSWRVPILRNPLAVAICGGLIAVAAVLYALLLSTPALLHGLTL